MRLRRALRDCKRRSLTVSKNAPTVSAKAPPPDNLTSTWEVLNGVGVDGVGGIFPFFFFAFFFFVFFLFFFAFLFSFFAFLLSLKGQGKTAAIYCKIGNFTPTLSALTPCKTSRSTGLKWQGFVGGNSLRLQTHDTFKGVLKLQEDLIKSYSWGTTYTFWVLI